MHQAFFFEDLESKNTPYLTTMYKQIKENTLFVLAVIATLSTTPMAHNIAVRKGLTYGETAIPKLQIESPYT